MESIIEYRSKLDGKLKDIVLDAPKFVVDKKLKELKDQGHTEISVNKTPP